jgi:hypothetical protein
MILPPDAATVNIRRWPALAGTCPRPPGLAECQQTYGGLPAKLGSTFGIVK